MTTNHAGQDMSPEAQAHRAEIAERVIGRLRQDPRTARENSDGGAGGFDFIRNAAARNNGTQAERGASRRAQVERVLAEMRAGR